jgi:hypothetical protein
MSSKKANSNEDWVSGRYFRLIIFVFLIILFSAVAVREIFELNLNTTLFGAAVNLATVMFVVNHYFKKEHDGKTPRDLAVFSILLYTAISPLVIGVTGIVLISILDSDQLSIIPEIQIGIFGMIWAMVKPILPSYIYLMYFSKDEES